MWHPNWFVTLLEFWIVLGNVKKSRSCCLIITERRQKRKKERERKKLCSKTLDFVPWPQQQQLLSFDSSSQLKNILCCLLPSLELSSAAVVVSGKALSRDLARRPGQRSLRCKRTLTGDRQDVGKSSLLAPLLQSFGNYQTSSSVTSAVDKHQEKTFHGKDLEIEVRQN